LKTRVDSGANKWSRVRGEDDACGLSMVAGPRMSVIRVDSEIGAASSDRHTGRRTE
jgi:hypothetical protein